MFSYLINNRPYTYVDSLTEEFLFAKDKNFLFDLSYLGLLRISGNKNREFLQGQLTCDLNKTNNYAVQMGLLCNIKGQIIATVGVFKQQNDILLLIPQDLLVGMQESLAKIALLSRVTVTVDKSYLLLGFFLQNFSDLMVDNGNFDYNLSMEKYGFDNALSLLLIKDNPLHLIDRFSVNKQYKGSLAWHFLRLTAYHPEIYPSTQKIFYPHRLNLQNNGYISFDKGCYKGQEIIARTHYRAVLKHDFLLFNIQTSAILQAGDRGFEIDTHKEVAQLVDYIPLDKEDEYLVALSILKSYENPLTFNQRLIYLR